MLLNVNDSLIIDVNKIYLYVFFFSIWVIIYFCEENNSNYNVYFSFEKYGIFDYDFVSGIFIIRYVFLFVCCMVLFFGFFVFFYKVGLMVFE